MLCHQRVATHFWVNLTTPNPEGSKFLKHPQFKLSVGNGMCNKRTLMLRGILSEAK